LPSRGNGGARLDVRRTGDAVGHLTESLHSSVVVCTKDRAASVRTTVATLRDQVDASPFEIVMVDDQSEPAVILDDLGGEPAVRVSRIAHQGRSAARNHGARLARGSVLLFLDDDMRVRPDFVAAHERAHRRWDRALVVGSVVPCDSFSKTPFGRFTRRVERKATPETAGIVDRPNFCTAANMSVSRSVFVDLGGFNPRLHCAEDQDLALRHSRNGRPIVYIPEAQAVHHDPALDIRASCRKAEWTGRHLVEFCRAQPAWPENEQRLLINGPLVPGREPAGTTAKKLGKWLLGQRAILEVLFALTALVERSRGDGPLLDVLYTTLVGIHLQRGFRSGLAASGRQPGSIGGRP